MASARTMLMPMSNRFLVNYTNLRPVRTLPIYRKTFSTAARQVQDETDFYPEIKPLYPPGKWGNISPEKAWKFYNEGVELNKTPHLKRRLEALAGDKHVMVFNLRTVEKRPNTLPFKQLLTKTHIEHGLPSNYNALSSDVDNIYDSVKSRVIDSILHVHDCQYLQKPKELDVVKTPLYTAYLARKTICAIYDNLIAVLSERDHLLRAQVDENVPIESFWLKTGFEKTRLKNLMFDTSLRFGVTYNATMQIRTELPMPQFASQEDALCSGTTPGAVYHPGAMLMAYKWIRPKTVSGHWVDDPCEFVHTHILGVEEFWAKFRLEHGEQLAATETLNMALVGGFGSCLAQAHHQGFNMYWDATYPFTTQVVVSDGQSFRFAAYQLNTLQLFKDNSANQLRNIMWKTEFEKLYETIENGQVKGFSDDICKNILKFMLMSPEERGVNLRPYLPEHPSPLQKTKLINNVGEETLPHHKFERWELRRNAIYDTMDS